MTKNEKYIVDMYVRYFGRAADAETIATYAEDKKTSVILKNIIADADAEKAELSKTEFVNNAFQNLFGRNATTKEMSKYYKVVDAGKDLPINSIVKSAAKNDKKVYENKKAVALKYAELGGKGDLDLSKISKGNTVNLNKVVTLTDLNNAIEKLADNSAIPSSFDGKTFTLTKGVDTLTGSAKDDKFVAADVTDAGGTSTTFTVGDNINGGAGTDVLEWIQTANITTIPTASKISNVEYINATSSGSITLDTTGSNITGLEKLTTTNKGFDQKLTASATQDVDATIEGAATASVTGGKNVKVTSKDNAAATSDVTVTNAAGTVTTVINDGYVDTDAGTTPATTTTLGDTDITGGTKINASSKVEFTAAQITAAKNITTLANQDIVAQGTVKVTGNASTTEVTVSQTAAQSAVAALTALAGTRVKVDGKIGVTAGTVTIADANSASTTDAGTITTVTLNNYGNSTINSGALTTVNLEGTAGTLGITAGALTTAKVDTLGLNLNNLSGATNTITVNGTNYKTLNIDSSTKASTVSSLSAASATKINVSGDAKLTISGATTLTAVKDIVVTNTAGFNAGTTAIGAAVNFTGGAGDDAVVLSTGFEKAITMGAGNDTVTYGGPASTTTGKLGSVNAGDGEDTIVMTSAQAEKVAGASKDSVFNGSFSGFEVLSLSAVAASDTIDLDGINAISKVKTATTGANTLTLDNMASNGRLTLTAGSTGGVTVNVKSALFGTADVLNINLENSTAATVAFGSVTAANVETININTVDKGLIGTDGVNVLATQDTATLVATSATKIVVTGNNGLNLTNAGNTKVTTFDASAVAGDNVEDTAAALGVVYASATTVAANTADTVVTIIGGAGNDVLTGNDTKDTITGGAGSDLITGGLNSDTINVGSGRDAISYSTTDAGVTDSSTAAFDSINNFTMATAITTGVDLTDVTAAAVQGKLAASTAGGKDMSLLVLNATTSGPANQAITVEGNATALAGQAAGVTYTIKDGILTLGGAGASSVDTLGEWLTEAAAVAATNGDALAFQFGSDTYAFVQNGNADLLVKLVGVTGAAAFAETSASTTGADNTIYFADIA